MNLAIQQTHDGSHTLRNLDINETYHSVHGAVDEALHIFIRAGLERVLENKSRIHLLEIGFGTGLNALLTIQKILEKQNNQQTCEIQYTSLEPYPVPMNIVAQLNYPQYLDSPDAFQTLLCKLHQVAWEKPQQIVKGFQLIKRQTTLAEFNSPDACFDLIYFDPFPPAAQPYLWDQPALSKLITMLSRGGVLTTYGAKGQFKRDLKALGMEVQCLPGPPGKREMTRAVKT